MDGRNFTPGKRHCCDRSRFLAGVTVLLFGLLIGLSGPVSAALPPANSVIGNQASATYTDAAGQSNVATSNLVETTVQQVGSFTLTQDNSKTAAVGNTVYMSHVLSNTGNGTDTFTLTLANVAGTFETSGVAIYADANFDGVPDNTTALCTGYPCSYAPPALAAGGTFGFVVSMAVPGTAANGNTDSVTVTGTAGTPALYSTSTRSNTDTLAVTTGAAFQVNKSVNTSFGPTGVVLTYTLTYRNIGAAAGNLALADVIGSGATVGLAYVAGSAAWSAGATTLTDAYTVGTPDATVGGSEVHYQATTTGVQTNIRATFTNIAPNVTGTVTFQVNVLGTATTGTASTTNTATFGADADSDPTNNTLTQLTNPSPYDVQASAGLVFNDGGSSTDGGNVRPAANDADSPNNADLSYVASASPGQTRSFDNYVWNKGTATDTFNIKVTAPGSPSWPAGTTFQLYKLDGASPMTDSNGDGTPDTGPLAPGASYKVVLRVTLPANACDPTCPSGPFDVQKTATSVNDPAQSNVTFDRLGSLVAPVVDLANSTGTVNAAVDQDAVSGSPTTTLTVASGGAVAFDLFVRNEGPSSDTYGLGYSTSNFAPGTIPAGWTVEFRTTDAGTCSVSGGSVINAIGPLAASAEQKFCAIVTVPVNASPGTVSVYFRAKSQVTGATNVKRDAVTVSAVNQLTMQPNHTGQVAPGGTVVYPHTLANTGNTTCGPTDAFTFSVSESLQSAGWTFVLYRDVNGDGAIDSGDTVVDPTAGLTGVTLAPSAELKLLVKVFAPAGATSGTTDVVSISATGGCGGSPTTSNTATENTTVIVGQVRVTKTQAIDHDCNGTPSLPSGDARTVGASYSAQPMQARPGECLLYRVVATNEGLGNVVDLALADTLPSFTNFSAGPTCSVGTGSYSAPTFRCAGVTPLITLTPAASATMDFRVQVQN
ncbi:MAG: hypothetical protein WBM03_15525 [Steroidobacteraceae bacterium]